jgi:hypothetical protein
MIEEIVMNKKLRRLKFTKTKGDVIGQGSRNMLSRPIEKVSAHPKDVVNRADVSLNKLMKSNNKKSARVKLVKGGKIQ